METVIMLALLPLALVGLLLVLALIAAPFNAIIERAEKDNRRERERKQAAELEVKRAEERALIRQRSAEKAARKAAVISGQRLSGDWMNRPL
jgi:adenylate kinase